MDVGLTIVFGVMADHHIVFVDQNASEGGKRDGPRDNLHTFYHTSYTSWLVTLNIRIVHYYYFQRRCKHYSSSIFFTVYASCQDVLFKTGL